MSGDTETLPTSDVFSVGGRQNIDRCRIVTNPEVTGTPEAFGSR